MAKAWGVDASPEMLEVARSRVGSAGLKLGSAEELPFKDGWFERATMWLVAHLVDRPRAFAEAARVLEPGGRFAVATFDPSYFDEFWLNELFPSMEAIDRERFPTADELTAELSDFADVRLTRLSQTGSLAARRRARADPGQAHLDLRPDRRRRVRGRPRARRARAAGAGRLPRRVADRRRRPANRVASRLDQHPFNPVP